MQVLRVLNTEAVVFCLGKLGQRCFVAIEYFLIGPVTNGMRANLKSKRKGFFRHLCHHGHGQGLVATVARLIRIIFEQPGSPRTQCPIAIEFDGTHRHPMLWINHWSFFVPLLQELWLSTREHDVHAGSELALFLKFLYQINYFLTRTCIVKGGDALFGKFFQGKRQGLLILFRGSFRDQFDHKR